MPPLGRLAVIVVASLLLLAQTSAAAQRPMLDLGATSRASAARLSDLDRLSRQPELARIATLRHVDERYAVPSFLVSEGGQESKASPGATPEQAARGHLARLAALYRLTGADVSAAPLRYVNTSGEGGIVVAFRQEVGGIPVFREEMKVLLDRQGGLVAVSGSIPGRAESKAPPTFTRQATDAIADALTDLTGAAVSGGVVHRTGNSEGGYETFAVDGIPNSKLTPEPIRARRVLFRLSEGLVAAYHVELTTEDEAPTYVIAADDGRVLLRHDRIEHDVFNYRLWAESGGLGLPQDGPQGTSATPHPTGVPDNYYPAFIAPTLVSLQNGPISTNDPWLAPGATTTSGNNVDAYADLTAPDGYNAGDLRATTTSAGTFDRTYDVNQQPDISTNQRMAAVTEVFYENNFLHDWFYDVGFTEAAGNAQVSNFGRGGIGGDPIHAEAQDYSGSNNADMMTPADGGSPRMQMYLWDPHPLRVVAANSPVSVAGSKGCTFAPNNPGTYSVTAPLALPFPGTFSATTTTLAAGSSPRYAQIADVSGDGWPDLIVSNANSNNVGVMLNDGTGGFLTPVTYATGNSPRMTVTPDLNHDGLPDLVSANLSGASITVRLGTGGGAFGASTALASASGACAIAVGRFDADTNDDVVVANQSANDVSVFLGDGLGSFAPRVLYAMGFGTISVAVGDLNGDGKADLVTANFSSNNMSVRLGTGTGTFGAATSFTTGTGPQSIALADLNGDGKLDAIVANSGTNTVGVLFGDGAGGFGTQVTYAVPASPVSVVASDFNGDGLIDVIVTANAFSGSVSLLANDGTGTLGTPQTIASTGNNPAGVQIGDVNNDHQPDLTLANSNSSNVTLYTGTVTPNAGVCAPFANTLTGHIALVPRGTCSFDSKVVEAAAKGAVGVILSNTGTSAPITFNLATTTGIPVVMISGSDGTALRSAVNTSPVSFTLSAVLSLRRDCALDNLVVAHEWAHYLSNRLIGDGSGLTTNQARGMGEGWSDFNAVLMEVRPEDAVVASNSNWTGTFIANGYAMASSAGPDNTFYFGTRRYPYSTDFNKNPLTFHHIQDGVPLPVGPPIQDNGGLNSEPHDTGEVWCNTLWECYASLLRDTPRLTFTQARDRMRRYLVQSLQMTPSMPTFLEARDALLSAAYATDLADYQDFCAAFARRGMGTGAVAPDRNSTNNSGVIESYSIGGDLRLASIAVDDSLASCDHDGYLDANEDGHLNVTLLNSPASVNLSGTTATISSSDPSLQFPAGNSVSFPASHPAGTTAASVRVHGGGSGIQVQNIHVQFNDPGLLVAGPRTASARLYLNVDEVASTSDGFETRSTPWTETGTFVSRGIPLWARVQPDTGSINRAFQGAALRTGGEGSLVSPPIVVGASSFSFTFNHVWWFSTANGGVVEISTDGGANWTDIGASITPGYSGTILSSSANPLNGRSGFTGKAAGYPALSTATASLGTTYAGQTVRIRFRIGTDDTYSNPGWTIDDVSFTGITNAPFTAYVADPGPCTPVAVQPPALPTELAFAVAGPNPSSVGPTFRFALPRPAHVTIAMYDLSGRRVATIADGSYSAGEFLASWASSRSASRKSGVYFARMMADGKVFNRHVVVLE